MKKPNLRRLLHMLANHYEKAGDHNAADFMAGLALRTHPDQELTDNRLQDAPPDLPPDT